jgi:hypothetical protein
MLGKVEIESISSLLRRGQSPVLSKGFTGERGDRLLHVLWIGGLQWPPLFSMYF